MTEEAKHTPTEIRSGRRYMLEFGSAMVGYALVLIPSVMLANEFPEWRLVLAVLPCVPLVFAFWAALRFMRRQDELNRQLQYEAISMAFSAGVLLTMAYGLLEAIGGLPRLSWTLVPPLFLGLWGISGFIARRRIQ